MEGNFGSPQRIETGSACLSRLPGGQLTPVCHFFGNAGWIRDRGVRAGDGIDSEFGRTSYENVIEPCRALGSRCPVNRIAERHGSLANRNKPRQPASQHHGPGAEAGGKAGGKTTETGATGGKHGCSAPDLTSPSNATDISTKAGARFSDGEDCRA